MENFEVENLRVYKPEHGEEPKPEAADIPRFWYCAPADILLDFIVGYDINGSDWIIERTSVVNLVSN